MRIVDLEGLNAARRARKAVVLMTAIDSGLSQLVIEGTPVDPTFAEPVAAVMRSGQSGTFEINGHRYFLNVHLPPAQLVIIGAVHIAQVLMLMARLAGFEVRIIDPRTAFATSERFAGADLTANWPIDALKARPLDAHTAVVAITHDPKIDDFPIAEALRTSCFYVGALGSRKTHGLRLGRLRVDGLSEGDLARINGPIGLDIGALGPAEIAVAILAQIIQALRLRHVSSLRSGTA